MKNLLKFSFVALLIISAFASCTKHTAEKTTSPYYLSATSTTIGSFYSSGTLLSAGGSSGTKLAISGTSSTGATMYLWLNPYPGITGTFALSDSNSGAEYITPTYSAVIISVHGTVTLTSVTPNIIGTFAYTGIDSVVVTGSFNVVPVP